MPFMSQELKIIWITDDCIHGRWIKALAFYLIKLLCSMATLLLKVMSGDTISLAVQSYYNTNSLTTEVGRFCRTV